MNWNLKMIATARRRATTMLLASSLAFFALLGTIPASHAANVACASHVDVINKLSQGYAEQPVALGLAANGSLIEVFSASDGRTWTLVMTRPDGLSCILASGHAWETVTKLTSDEVS